MEATNTGTLPLHLACKRADSGKESKCIDVVRYLLTTFPDAVRYRDNENKFPLDHALQDQVVNLDIIRLLIQEYPVLLSFPDDSGMLPLHRTLKSSFGLRHQTVVELLVDGYEGALRLQDKDGYTPLLYACTMNRRLSTVYSLVRKWPEQVMVGHAANSIIFGSPDKFNGELLHSSFSSKASKLESVVKWLERYPDGIWNKDLHGRLPIHYAVISPSHDALAIVCLFLEHEDGTDSGCNDDVENKDDGRPRRTRQLATPDNDGRLPLHFASACPRCSNEMLTMLIQRYPKALIHEDNDGRLCWHYADLARQDVVFEETTQRYRDVEYDLELVPEEIRWDIVQVLPDV
jgi:ankyrin repeat protein